MSGPALDVGAHVTVFVATSPEKDVAGHLEHLARSLRRSGARLVVEPSRCRDCDWVFRDRTRLTRPSACPRCRGQHVSAPVFHIEDRA